MSGKTTVIAGATSGTALATAKLFVGEGAYVFITGRRQDVLDAAVKAERGHVDIVFASAGKGQSGKPLGTITEADVHEQFSVNVRGSARSLADGRSSSRIGT